ncbi:MAG: TauD/TfdA family dioxygenase [Alphaproteobacteria bacterium]|nr:TauD/TfdA family dioxygenase [Alphaproteobacteria bacterium]
MSGFEIIRPLPGANFGARIEFDRAGAASVVASAGAHPEALPAALAQCGGLLLIKDMQAIADDPALLIRLSHTFGVEVEDYTTTLTAQTAVHATVPQILVVSNLPPVNRPPPARPDPPLTADGKLPVQYPQRSGWHTDQSYRRPPPDISLFFAVTPVSKHTGQTIFANGTLAYAALPPALKARVEGRDGLHVRLNTGRSRTAVLRGDKPRPLAPHELPQRQPLVRLHPVTGAPALYLCESSQMDWVDGPIVGLEPGPHGDGAALLDELMTHLTRPEFVYAHEWERGDVLVWDNRCLVHTATWFDAEVEGRVMWRTTVHGNPGPLYAGESKSWLPQAAE